MQTIILNLNHYNWFVSKKRFVSKIGYIDFVPLSRKLSLELEFKDMKQTQYVDKTSLTLNLFSFFFFGVRFLSVLRGHSFFIPATTANGIQLQRISIPDFIHYIYFPILNLEKKPVFSLLKV